MTSFGWGGGTSGTPGFGEAQGVATGEGASDGGAEVELVSEEQGDLLPNGGTVHLADGHVLKINDAQWRALLHRKEAVDAITDRAEQIADAANSLVALPPEELERLDNGEPAYIYWIQNRTDTVRPRARIFPRGRKGRLDEAMNCTLEKVKDSFRSDPIPTGVGPERDSAQTPDTGEFESDSPAKPGTVASEIADRFGEE